jgi:serine protease Do
VAMQIKDSGKVSRGWLGVLIQEVTRDLAETFGMKTPHGALVARVMDDSPAQQAGLQVGDVIVEFNGKKVTRSSSLPPLVGRTPVNKYADVTIIRNHKQKTIKVKIAQLPTDITQAAAPVEEPKQVEKSALGMSVTPLDKASRDKLNLSSGVLVMDIDAQGPASNAGIRKGDVISMIDNHSVNSVDEFKEVVDGLEDQKSVAILIQRSSGPVFLAIKPDKS